MAEFQLHSSLIDYDPEEEERKRTEALAALAAQGGGYSATASLDMPALAPPPPSLDDVAYRALAIEGEEQSSVPPPPAEQVPQGTAPARGADSAHRSPEMKELTNPDQGTKPAEPPPHPDPLEALVRKGEERQARLLEAYDKQGEPSVNGWALLADVAFNKGRSIPQMLQMAENDKRAYREGRQKLLQGGAHSDPVNQAIAMGNLQARQATGQRLTDKDASAAEADANARTAFMSSWGKYMTPEEQEAFSNAPASSFRTMAGQIRDRIKNSREYQDDHARGQKLDATARKEGDVEGLANVRPTAVANTTALSEADANARLPALIAANAGREANVTPEEARKEGREIDAAKRAEESLRLQREGAAAREQADRDRVKAAKDEADRRWITDYGNKHIKQTDTAKLVDELDDIITAAEAEGGKPPGLGIEQIKDGLDKYPLDQTGRAISALVGSDEYNDFQSRADYNRKLLGRLGESVYRIDTGASGNEREEMRAAIANALKPTATLDDIKNTSKLLRTRLTSQLGNVAAAAPDLAAQSLAGAGISNPGRWLGHIPRPNTQQPAAAPAQDPSLAPGQTTAIDEQTGDEVVDGAGAGFNALDVPDTLPTTDQKPRDLPRVKDAVKKPSAEVEKLRNVPDAGAAGPKMPDGNGPMLPFMVNGRRKMLTQEQAEWLLANRPGWTVTQ